MPDLANLGALSLPAAATLIGTGWGLCFRILVQPLTERLNAAETKLDAYEAREAERMKRLEARAGY